MKKRLFYLVVLALCLSLCVTLFSCGEGNTGASSSQGDSQNSTPPSDQSSGTQGSAQESTQPSTNQDITPPYQKPATQPLDFTLSEDGSYYIVTGSSENSGWWINIPEAYESKPVKEIAGGAFSTITGPCSVLVPETVEAIGANAFSGENLLVFFDRSSPIDGFANDFIENSHNCFWYSEKNPLTRSDYSESLNYWHYDEFNVKKAWIFWTEDDLLEDNEAKTVSVYTQYASILKGIDTAAPFKVTLCADGEIMLEYSDGSYQNSRITLTTLESAIEKLDTVKAGDTFEDVFAIDSFGSYPWLFAGRTDFPQYSYHFSKECIYYFEYEDLVVTSIVKIVPKTN